MSTVSVTNAFVNGAANDGPQVTANFTDLTSYINANCITKDGATSLTALLSGPATDPTSANHLARKQYVDDRVGMVSVTTAQGNLTTTAANTYQNIGSQLTITNPAKAVIVLAWLHGFVQNIAFSTLHKVNMGISFDNAATYPSLPQQFMTIEPAGVKYSPFSMCVGRTGTPTGNIRIRAQGSSDTLGSTFFEPYITYQMFKSVTV